MDASTKSEHHVYEVRPRKDHGGVDLIPDALPFGRLWYGELLLLFIVIGLIATYFAPVWSARSNCGEEETALLLVGARLEIVPYQAHLRR
jgi:hypothetical protein